jgi:hypothetical protein
VAVVSLRCDPDRNDSGPGICVCSTYATNQNGDGMRHGFQSIGASIGVLVEEKNKAYGDSFAQSGKVLRILYPDGVKPDQYDDFLAVTRVIDKLFRIATRKDALGESPWKDISGSGILGVALSVKRRPQRLKNMSRVRIGNVSHPQNTSEKKMEHLTEKAINFVAHLATSTSVCRQALMDGKHRNFFLLTLYDSYRGHKLAMKHKGHKWTQQNAS